MRCSVVIPCHNEEHYLPKLLDDMVSQHGVECDVVVVDSNCSDGTVAVAKSYQDRLAVKVVSEKAHGVAAARNRGAQAAQSDVCVFMDADLRVPSDFLYNYVTEFKRSGFDVAGVRLRSESSGWLDRIGTWVYYTYCRLMSYTQHPIVVGACIGATVSAHRRLRGFDTKQFILEDYDYATRTRQTGMKFGFVRGTYAVLSHRRFRSGGAVMTTLRAAYGELYRVTHGFQVRKTLYDYQMGGSSSAGTRDARRRRPKADRNAR